MDEYLSVPEYYGPLPPGEVIGLGANPRLMARLTGADPERVRAIARTATAAATFRRPDPARRELATAFGLPAPRGYEAARAEPDATDIPRT